MFYSPKNEFSLLMLTFVDINISNYILTYSIILFWIMKSVAHILINAAFLKSH